MRSSRLHFSVFACQALAILLAVACSEGRSASIGAHGLTPAYEKIVAARCDALMACPSGALYVFDKQTCMRAGIGALLCSETGSAPLDADVERCVRALRELDCEQLVSSWWPAGCDGVYRQLVDPNEELFREGELCAGDWQCDVDLSCPGRTPECAGRCSVPPRTGEACTDKCQGNDVCSSDKVCEPPRPAGASCLDFRDCADDCVGNVCRGATELLGKRCAPVREDVCGVTLRCASGRCAAFAAPGEACDVAADCYDGLSCIDGACVLVSACGTGRLGDACSASGQCRDGFYCDRLTRQCSTPAARGEACSYDIPCAEGSCNIDTPDRSTCGSPLPRTVGASCTYFFDCDSYFCIDGRCRDAIACE